MFSNSSWEPTSTDTDKIEFRRKQIKLMDPLLFYQEESETTKSFQVHYLTEHCFKKLKSTGTGTGSTAQS
jgi:hypothetical protein